jgi:hypothetical protein|tara:strand:+ start:58 stop:186 length:129 start_codon:yes stop_codon:yes gene_type:complete
MTEDEKKQFFKSLRERVYELKIAYLFEEPCPLYEPEEDDEHF